MFAPIASETRSPFNASNENQRVIAGAGEAGGDEHRADLVAVQAGGVGLVIQAWSAHMHGR